MKGQKTGGRQKGTPNKLTASVKYMFKALMMNNYDLLEDSFQKAKPNERLNFIAKMTPFICAKEQPGKNGGEWVMGDSMDHDWFKIYESDHLLRRKQRIQFEENYAFQELNYRQQCEWNTLANMVKTAKNAGMEPEDLIKLMRGEFEAFHADASEDKRRLRDNFRQRRENFQKIEQEYFDQTNEQEDSSDTTPSDNTSNSPAFSVGEASDLDSSSNESPSLNSSTLDESTPSNNSVGEYDGTSCPAQSAIPQASNIRILKKTKQRQPF